MPNIPLWLLVLVSLPLLIAAITLYVDVKKQRDKAKAREGYAAELIDTLFAIDSLIKAKTVRQFADELRKILKQMFQEDPWELIIPEPRDPKKDPFVLSSGEFDRTVETSRLVLGEGRVFINLPKATAESFASSSRLQRITEEAVDILSTTKLAILDVQTGLASHNHFRDVVEAEFERALRYYPKDTFSVIAFDLDGLKAINDELGHSTGDKVIEKVAEVLKKHHRKEIDTPARNGIGDEFAILLPMLKKKEALALAEELREEIGGLEFKGKSPVTASFGVVSYGRRFKNYDQMLRAVDRALYRSKRRGRNTVTVAR